MNRTIKIPLAALPVISDLIIDNDLQHEIIASNNAEPSVTLDLTYDKSERSIVHMIHDCIDDYLEGMPAN
ncbi:MAG: hypothetical protein J0L80_05045 [Chitinophagales bacterium]|nr:hypothetical protein [Chitinophagales bacterium]